MVFARSSKTLRHVSGWLDPYKSLRINFPPSFPSLPSSIISHSVRFLQWPLQPSKDKALIAHGLRPPLLLFVHGHQHLVTPGKAKALIACSLRPPLPLSVHGHQHLVTPSKAKALIAHGLRPPLLLSLHGHQHIAPPSKNKVLIARGLRLPPLLSRHGSQRLFPPSLQLTTIPPAPLPITLYKHKNGIGPPEPQHICSMSSMSLAYMLRN